MGYYKDRHIEKLQQEFEEREAEKAAASYLQPTLSPEFSDYPEASTLLDFVRALHAKKAAYAETLAATFDRAN